MPCRACVTHVGRRSPIRRLPSRPLSDAPRPRRRRPREGVLFRERYGSLHAAGNFRANDVDESCSVAAPASNSHKRYRPAHRDSVTPAPGRRSSLGTMALFPLRFPFDSLEAN